MINQRKYDQRVPIFVAIERWSDLVEKNRFTYWWGNKCRSWKQSHEGNGMVREHVLGDRGATRRHDGCLWPDRIPRENGRPAAFGLYRNELY